MASISSLKDRSLWTALPFSLSLLLGVLQLLQVSAIAFSVMEHRVWFEVGFVVGVDLGWLIIVVCVVCLVLLLAERRIFLVFPLVGALFGFFAGVEVGVPFFALVVGLAGLLAYRNWRNMVFWVLGMFSLVELVAVLYWLILAPLALESPLQAVALFEESMFYLLTPLSLGVVAAIMVLCLIGPFRTIFAGWRSRVRASREELAADEESGSKLSPLKQVDGFRRSLSRGTVLVLLGIIAYAVFSVFYTTLPGINPYGVDIGVDVSSYVSDLGNIAANFSYIFKAEGGSRPIFFVFLTAIQRVLGLTAFEAITYSPLVLAPLLTLSVFFLAREVVDDDRYALWASFFTVAGFHLVVGMFSYFLTNMLGLAIAYAMLTLVFRFYRRPRLRELAGAVALAVALLFTHPWTFDQVVAGLVPVVIYMALRGENKQARTLSRVGIIGSIVLLGAAEGYRVMVLGGVGAVSSLNVLLLNFTSVEGFASAFYNSVFYYNGLYANLVLLALVAVGIYAWRIRGAAGMYFTSFLLFSSLIFLLVETDTKDRLLFNFPFGILAAVGLMKLAPDGGNRLSRMIPIFVALFLLAYQLRSLANLV